MGVSGRRLRAASSCCLLMAVVVPASASASPPHPPTPEPNAAVDLLPRPCALEGNDPYEKRTYKLAGWEGPDYVRYPGACQRLRFSYGPIVVKPGQNDVLVDPIKIEKPLRDGYITRFEPNLVLPDGTVPPIEQVHLHHGTWLSATDYGRGPFFAAGEEKTVAPFPTGYGMPVKASDVWLLLYMVHSAVQKPMTVYITYDVDFIPQNKAEDLGIKPAYPVWLDVRPSGYPVFNTQRDYGKGGECTWPKQECASFNPWGDIEVGQGAPGNGLGEDLELPDAGDSFGQIQDFQGGTLIGIGGHLHPGGLENEIDLVRDGKSRRIYTGKALYWKHRPGVMKPGGPPTSWDFSMRVIGAPYWGVRVEPGDALRSNVTYDTDIQSTYENMGIAVTLLAPDTPDGKHTAPGVDPFKAPADHSLSCRSKGLLADRPTLCDEGGLVTHGPLPENDNYGGAQGEWTAKTGSSANGNVQIANFLYEPGDLSMINMTGVPTVKLGDTLNFNNLDGAAIYHTVTSCGFPCLGPTGTTFPIADGTTSAGRSLDFDSGELGFGTPEIGPAKQTLQWGLPITADDGYKPGEVVTYYCRIHPSMRGAFEVVK
jgi:hypothetical protein